jgi:hypothetical protein
MKSHPPRWEIVPLDVGVPVKVMEAFERICDIISKHQDGAFIMRLHGWDFDTNTVYVSSWVAPFSTSRLISPFLSER